MNSQAEQLGNADSGLTNAEDVNAAQPKIEGLRKALSSVVMGQDAAIDELIVGLIANGHILIEGIPGVAKTLLARSLAALTHLSFQRVQFTPDLMPSDLIGTSIWNQESRNWEFHKGPIFAQILLADEVNRTPPKTQAALLEAMEERQVSIDGKPKELGPPFFVIATENPLDFEGTYPLPEAQKDRFLLKIIMSYPDAEAEKALLNRGRVENKNLVANLPTLLEQNTIFELQTLAERIRADSLVVDYLWRILQATRQSSLIRLGASPRAGLLWLAAAKARALLQNRYFLTPDDIKGMAHSILRHRLALSTQAELDGLTIETVLDEILSQVEIQES
jgi:MoxR-like ATPase